MSMLYLNFVIVSFTSKKLYLLVCDLLFEWNLCGVLEFDKIYNTRVITYTKDIFSSKHYHTRVRRLKT